MSDLIVQIRPSRRRAALVILVGGYINISIIAIQGFVLAPLYLKYIGSHLYGAWLGSGDILGWLAIVDLGLASLMIQRIATAYSQENRKLTGQYFASGLLTQLFLVVVLIIGAIIFSIWVPGWMAIEKTELSTFKWCFVTAGVASGLNILNNGIAGFAIALQKTVFMTVAAIISNLLDVAVTLILLLTGWGLWSIPLGLLIGSSAALIANTGFAVWVYRHEIQTPFRPSRQVLRDFATVIPTMSLAKIGNALMGQSEGALIAIFIRPELVTVYVLTRRAADLIRMLLDRFGGAVFAGFSSLVGTKQRVRANEVHTEVMSLYFSCGILMIGTYLAVNKTFIHLWVGNDLFGGSLLTFLIGVNVLTTGSASLLNYLYGATGRIARSSSLLFIETLVRVPLMIVLLWKIGLSGLPLAAIVTSTISGQITKRWTDDELKIKRAKFKFRASFWGYGLVLLITIIVGTRVWADSWSGMCALLICIAISNTVIIMLFNAHFRNLIYMFKSRLDFLMVKKILNSNV